jgi:hypothetical protein
MAMRQHQFTALGLALALVLGACGPDEQDFSAPDPDETPVAEQAPTDAPANGDEDIPEAEPFESPIVEEDDIMTAAPSGLISSTNPQERSRQAQRNLDAGREDGADPFGILPVEVSRSQRQAEAVAPQVPGEPAPGSPGAGNGETVDGMTAGPPLPPLTAQTMEPLPDINPGQFILPPLTPAGTVDSEDFEEREPEDPSVADSPVVEPEDPSVAQDLPVEEAPAIPSLPSTDLAQGTEVTGVIQVGGDLQIILQTPGSAFSRYVRVGDTIANGEVQVVRVERLSGDPVVILEQNGVEVAREIGASGGNPDDADLANWVGRR